MAKNNDFTPAFRKYKDMTDGEKAAFRQGASMVDNSVQERLGLKPPREQRNLAPPDKTATAAPLKNSAAPKDDFYKRYQQVKAKHSGAILFFRLGDFYEVLGADAQTVSKTLDLTLTARSIGNERIPMCGVPYHTLENYLATLVKSGYKVAVAEGGK